MALNCILIDDSLFIRETVKSIIEGAGHRMSHTFENGPVFLNTMNSIELPDVIFCDIILPQMTGLDLLEIITEGFPNSKIIMLSGVTHGEAISAALRLGALDFLQKPVNKDRLLLLLEKLEKSISVPSVEKLSTIGVGTTLVSGFLDELTAHSSSTLRKVISQQCRTILMDIESKTKGMLIIDVENTYIEPDPKLWGVHKEEEVLQHLGSIPEELKFELSFLYSDEFVDNLFDQAIMTMSSKKRYVQLFEAVSPGKIGLPQLPSFDELSSALDSKAGTTFQELDNSISIAVFIFDETGPEVITRLNPDLLSEADLMKNSIFYYTLIDEDNFQEGLFGPLPVTSAYTNTLSSLAYTMKKKVHNTDKEQVIIVSIYYEPAAESIVADYNKISFIIRTRLVPLEYSHEIDKPVLRGLLDDIIDYLLDG